MTEICLNRVEHLFHLGMQVKTAERASFLSRQCGDDELLYEEVISLLKASDDDSALEEPVIDLGLRVIATSQQRDLTGKIIDQFKILSLLARGGMGEVYLAQDQQLDRRVALKFVCEELAEDDTEKQQLLAEARAVARLDHPSICQIYSIQQLDGDTFLVMQYIEGMTLAQVLRSSKLTEVQQDDFIRQIVSAMAHTHANRLIHRDLKPRNIMITPLDKVKILDFGLAASPQPIKVAHRATPGTLRYMSPEQLRGETLDFRSDVFSLGTLMYEILTGQRLFPQQEEVSIARAIVSGDYSLDAIATNRSLFPIISRCLSLDPLHRYDSATELLRHLNEQCGN